MSAIVLMKEVGVDTGVCVHARFSVSITFITIVKLDPSIFVFVVSCRSDMWSA